MDEEGQRGNRPPGGGAPCAAFRAGHVRERRSHHKVRARAAAVGRESCEDARLGEREKPAFSEVRRPRRAACPFVRHIPACFV